MSNRQEISSANEEDIARLLKGREICDAYRVRHAEGFDESAKLAEDIKASGFASIGDFFKFNEEMCIQAIAETPHYGECDFCKGYNGVPRCQEWFGKGGCAVTKVKPTKKEMYRAIFMKIQVGLTDFFYQPLVDVAAENVARLNYIERGTDKKTGIYWYCTKGHGFYIKLSELKPSRFLLTWK